MRPIGNGTKLRLILGGGERLEGQGIRSRGLSTPSEKAGALTDKQDRILKAAGQCQRLVMC
jgi:hypothetical protein